MDDKEYYTLMNRSSSYALQQALKKKNNSANKKSGLKTLPVKQWTVRQGSADAQMLYEKQSDSESNSED